VTVFYNEIDPYAADWLRNLISAGAIAPGEVDERSIADVKADDLKGYTQCHFFAGIGVWSHALRLAGWPDDRPVWTGSCPCQPFSSAGKGAGFADERHLWPVWFRLIRECQPVRVVGEQVASKAALAWYDTVSADLEGQGYAVGAVDMCAAGIGAPHIRQRLFWLADSGRQRHERRGSAGELEGAGGDAQGQDLDQAGRYDVLRERQRGGDADSDSLPVGRLAQDPASLGRRGRGDGDSPRDDGQVQAAGLRGADGVGHAEQGGRGRGPCEPGRGAQGRAAVPGAGEVGGMAGADRPSPTNGFWRAADWLFCRDGKWRPVEPGTFPLAHELAPDVGCDGPGAPAYRPQGQAPWRAGMLRGYGNAIVAELAAEFVRALP